MAMKVESSEKLAGSRHLNLFRIDYRDRNGEPGQWVMASRRRTPKVVSGRFDPPDAVVIVPWHRDRDRLVLIREFRVTLGDFQYGFPAGLVDAGESVEDAARRELEEETGLQVRQVLHTGPATFTSAGLTDEAVSMVTVECGGEPSLKGNEGSEEIEVLFVDPEGAGRLCADPTIRFDLKAWLVASAFARFGRV